MHVLQTVSNTSSQVIHFLSAEIMSSLQRLFVIWEYFWTATCPWRLTCRGLYPVVLQLGDINSIVWRYFVDWISCVISLIHRNIYVAWQVFFTRVSMLRGWFLSVRRSVHHIVVCVFVFFFVCVLLSKRLNGASKFVPTLYGSKHCYKIPTVSRSAGGVKRVGCE